MNARITRLAENSWQAWIAALAIETAVAFLIDPTALSRSPIGRTLHPFDYAWTVSYGLAGVLMLVGLLAPLSRSRLAVRAEMLGLLLFVAAASIQIVAVLAVAGMSGAVSIGVLVAGVLAALGRIVTLLRPGRPSSAIVALPPESRSK